MLSRIAAPNWSGPPEASCPSSKTITILLMMSVGKTGGNAVAGFQSSRINPEGLGVWDVGGGECQPIKITAPSDVTISNRGAPAPQCDPSGLVESAPDFLISYPSSL